MVNLCPGSYRISPFLKPQLLQCGIFKRSDKNKSNKNLNEVGEVVHLDTLNEKFKSSISASSAFSLNV